MGHSLDYIASACSKKRVMILNKTYKQDEDDGPSLLHVQIQDVEKRILSSIMVLMSP